MFEIEKKAVEYCEQYGIDEDDPRRSDVINAFCVGAKLFFPPATAVPATVEPVELKQFLADVLTAAGLLSHGKRDKGLATRLGEQVMHYYTHPAPAVPECTWVLDNTDAFYSTNCNNAFILNDGTPEENDMRFCPYCGGAIKVETDFPWDDTAAPEYKEQV